jgi:hydroxyacylglutathione hydrolase
MQAHDLIDHGHGIFALDAFFERPRLTAIHLVVESGRAAIIDPGTATAVPRILAALEALGLAPETVDWIVLTHIHLDHAGGAGLLASRLPNARLTVHPRGRRHMVDPARLWASTIEVYGQSEAERLYGVLLPVPEDRVVETPDGASIAVAGRALELLDTPGHARHHVCIRDARTGHLFTGDTFGLAYTELDAGGKRFVFPTTSPNQWDPDAHHASVARLEALQPKAVYVTHFSRVDDVPRLAGDLHRLIDAHAELGRSVMGMQADDARQAVLQAGVERIVLDEARGQGWGTSRERALEVFALDIDLNARGIAAWLDASRPAS